LAETETKKKLRRRKGNFISVPWKNGNKNKLFQIFISSFMLHLKRRRTSVGENRLNPGKKEDGKHENMPKNTQLYLKVISKTEWGEKRALFPSVKP
jgi:hypothetical protein